jgi:broad specificity phosphatase PhoE
VNAWLVRHAETEWSRDGRHTGRTDVPLTDAGRRYAAGPLREALAGQELALVLCSPLSRARETCELAGLGDRMQVRDDLLEWDYGEYEGITTADIRRTRPDWFLWRDGAPGGETAGQVGARADRVVAEALAAGGDVALFSHGHVLRVIGARWIEQPAELGGRLALSTGALCRLGCEREVRVIWTWNLRATRPAGA